jgi:hypothetical protein
VRDVETKTMARRRWTELLLLLGMARRRCSRRRSSSGVDELDDALRERAEKDVTEVRTNERKRGEVTRGLCSASPHRKTKISPSVTAELR